MPLGFAFCETIQTAVFYSLEKEIDMKIWLQNFASSFKLHDSILISVSISDQLPNTSSSQGNNFRYWLLKTRYSTILSRDSMINKHIKQSYTLTEPEHVKQISSSLDTQVYVHPASDLHHESSYLFEDYRKLIQQISHSLCSSSSPTWCILLLLLNGVIVFLPLFLLWRVWTSFPQVILLDLVHSFLKLQVHRKLINISISSFL